MFEIKTSRDNANNPRIERYKARLVARGDFQSTGLNYDEVYTPVIQFVSLRIILHIAASLDLEIDQGDFVSAFLNGHLGEEICITQPQELVSTAPSKVCLLRKSLYGLKQSARVWYAYLDTELRSQSMLRLPNDQASWISQSPEPEFTLAHVDDLLFIGSRQQTSARKALLASKYEFKDLGPAFTFIGLQITRDRTNRRVYIDQGPYVLEILEEFGLLGTAPVAIPMEPKETWDVSTDRNHAPLSPTETTTYQRAIGKLMYLMLATPPDVAYAVTKLAQYASTPTSHH